MIEVPTRRRVVDQKYDRAKATSVGARLEAKDENSYVHLFCDFGLLHGYEAGRAGSGGRAASFSRFEIVGEGS